MIDAVFVHGDKDIERALTSVTDMARPRKPPTRALCEDVPTAVTCKSTSGEV